MNKLDELKDGLTEEFKRLDVNGDGRISRAEAEDAAREHFGGKILKAMGVALVTGLLVGLLIGFFAQPAHAQSGGGQRELQVQCMDGLCVIPEDQLRSLVNHNNAVTKKLQDVVRRCGGDIES